VRRKLAYDIYYVQQQGFLLDCRILGGTVVYLAGLPCCVIQRLLGIPDGDAVERQYQNPLPQSPHLPEFNPV